MQFIHPEKMIESFKNLGKFVSVTRGSFSYPRDCSLGDLWWNHMDQAHRPTIHRTYRETVRLITSENFALSIYFFRLGPIHIPIQVTDIHLESHLTYQSFTLLGIFYVLVACRPNEKDALVEWYISSQSIFKWMHPILSKRIWRLNEVQNTEDLSIRARRRELRSKGYWFKNDIPNFKNSNSMGNNTLYPTLNQSYELNLLEIPLGKLTKMSAGPIDLIVRRDNDAAYTLWLSACPHDGAPLEEGTVCKNSIRCTWHGLSFTGLTLTPTRATGQLSDFGFQLSEGKLRVNQVPTGQQKSHCMPLTESAPSPI